ncbi:MAG: OsmC family peroxiredoxin [Bauldia sp.]|nr:OsmC family peroxiredoxin [Bauldia sp.]
MLTRTSDAEWHGTLREGRGHMRFGGGAYDGAFTWRSRFSDGGGTNPEELIAAAHAGCFSMALSGDLVKAGFAPNLIRTSAEVHLEQVDGAWTITLIELTCGAEVPGIDKATFDKVAEGTRLGCPVSRALKGVKITLGATLKN